MGQLARQALIFLLKISLSIFSPFMRDDKNITLENTIKLYRGTGFTELFSKIRLWDTPVETLEKFVPPKGNIMDLGCGDGLITNYLALSSPKRKLTGVDKNKERLKKAYRGLRNTKFTHGDVLKENFAKVDVILGVHVLHHLESRNSQEALIKECVRKLKKNGSLIIVEIAKRPLLKYIFTWFTDSVIVPILFEKKLFDKNIFYRDIDDWKNLFKKNGLVVKTKIAHEGKPFSHIIIMGTKTPNTLS